MAFDYSVYGPKKKSIPFSAHPKLWEEFDSEASKFVIEKAKKKEKEHKRRAASKPIKKRKYRGESLFREMLEEF